MAIKTHDRWLREPIRIKFPGAIGATLAIESVGGCPVSSGTSQAAVVALERDQLKFASRLRFPISAGYRLSFAFELYDQPFRLSGYVTGRRDESTRYVYSVRLFVPDEIKGRLEAALERRRLAVRQAKERVHARYRAHAALAVRPRRRDVPESDASSGGAAGSFFIHR